MHRSGGLDSAFLSLETRTNLFHVGSVTVLDPATAPPGTPEPHEALRRVIEERLHLLGPFRRRLAGVPFGLDHPHWVEDTEVDVGFHVRRGHLPRPGGPAELAAYVADVLSRPLDRTRPLWEIHVLEGLQGDLVAGVNKIHHSVIDGVAGVELTANLMDLAPQGPPTPPPAEDWQADPWPSAAALAGEGLRRLTSLGARATATAATAAGAAVRIRARNRQPGAAAPPAPFTAPRTSLGGRVGTHRAVGLGRVERADVDEVRAATGASVNDVILFLAASVLRDHLAERGELPDKPLVGFVPVSVRAERDTLDTGVNKLSAMLVSLATTVEDPQARLAAIHDSARNAKDQDRILGPGLMERALDLLPPAVLTPAAQLASRAGLMARRPPFNVVISSFPGSPVPLYCGGARMLAYHPFGPVIDGACLNITAMSYVDHLGFGLLADADAVPDVDALALRFPDALTQLAKESR
jgi:diacylglycerol O-acyltransferase / wax synthase